MRSGETIEHVIMALACCLPAAPHTKNTWGCGGILGGLAMPPLSRRISSFHSSRPGAGSLMSCYGLLSYAFFKCMFGRELIGPCQGGFCQAHHHDYQLLSVRRPYRP